MDEPPVANGEITNPIYGSLVDYASIESVYRQIEALDDPRLTLCKVETANAFERLQKGCLVPGECPAETASDNDWRRLSNTELAIFSQQVIGDVCRFVTAAIVCYRTVSSFRSLDTDEKRQGEILRELLKSMQELIPARRCLEEES